MKTSDFNYHLPPELIAQTPTERRDASRMLTVSRADGGIQHKRFYNLPEFLKAGDCLVLNNSRVLPARLSGKRESGGTAEVLLLRDNGGNVWECLVKPGKSLREGAKIIFGGGEMTGTVEKVYENGKRLVGFSYDGDWNERLYNLGAAPLPPYIKEKPPDPERYQTVYAKSAGSAAAPTAGLHFTHELLESVKNMGVTVAEITLHVGLGTFLPVSAEDVKDHTMHTEWVEIGEQAAAAVNRTRASGGRVIAVGTTACRTLESAASKQGELLPGCGETGLFITPGYTFRLTDALITNFHLPRSTLLMLVSAFYTREGILAAYEEAVREKYRFYSFGDCCLIL
jgi:S-adenosylmethionine:tRNA ribosyltransferase-isomerase